MGNLVFSPPVGRSWPIKKTPKFSTQVLSTVSGRGQLRNPLYQYPIWEFDMNFGYLRGNEQLSQSEYQYLVGFYLAVQGAFDSFLYWDLKDNQVTNCYFATGNGVATEWQLTRNIGIGVDIVQAPIIPGPSVAPFTIYANNTALSASGYTVQNGLVEFISPPANGAILTWSGQYYYRLHFLEDSLSDLQMSMDYKGGLWELDSLKMESVLL